MRKILKILLSVAIIFSFSAAIPAANASIASEAQSYTVGRQYSGVSKSNGSVYFKFTLNTGSALDFWTECEYNCRKTNCANQGDPLVRYTLYNSAGSVVFNSENMNFNNNAVTGYCEGEYSLSLPKDTYYLDVYGVWGCWNYSFNFYTHTHTYTTSTSKATTSKNGKIVKKCSKCGDIVSTTTIYYPKTIKLSQTTYVYNGKAQKPAVTVKDANGKTISSKYYTLTWSSGRKSVGTYKVKITFKGNYSGSVTKSFKIIPKGTSISSLTAQSKGFTVKWKKQSTQTTGYQLRYSTSSSMSGAKTVTVSKTGTVSKAVTKCKAKTKYYVQVRTYKTVSGTKYYSSWSTKKAVTTKK